MDWILIYQLSPQKHSKPFDKPQSVWLCTLHLLLTHNRWIETHPLTLIHLSIRTFLSLPSLYSQPNGSSLSESAADGGNLKHCSSTGWNQSPVSHSGGILRREGKKKTRQPGRKIQRCRLRFHCGVSPVSGAPRTSPWNKWKQFHSADCWRLYSQAWFSATFFLMDCLWDWLQERSGPAQTHQSPDAATGKVLLTSETFHNGS